MFTSSITNIVQGVGVYDSEINFNRLSDHENLDLKITLKVYLRPVNEGKKVIHDADGGKFKIDEWPAGEWNKFKAIYQTNGQNFWDNKFWLQTPADYHDFEKDMWGQRPHSGQTTRVDNKLPWKENRFLRKPNLNCRFQLELVDSGSASHISIDVNYISHRLEKKEWIAIKPGQNPDFRSSMINLDSGDEVESSTKFGTETITRFTFIHEIGHALGLEHAGVVRNEQQCIKVIKKRGAGKGSKNFLCYGLTKESYTDVMGWGTTLTWHDALPWRVAAEHHTSINRHQWQIHQTPLPGLIREFAP